MLVSRDARQISNISQFSYFAADFLVRKISRGFKQTLLMYKTRVHKHVVASFNLIIMDVIILSTKEGGALIIYFIDKNHNNS